MPPFRINVIPGDWADLERKLNYLTRWIASQPLTDISLPEFAGLTLTGFSGVLKATAGVLSGSAAHSDLGGVTANQHHNQAHVLNSTDHTVSGLTTGHVLQATSATTFEFASVLGLIPAETDPVAMGYIDQSVKQAASPIFANLYVATAEGTIILGGNLTIGVNYIKSEIVGSTFAFNTQDGSMYVASGDITIKTGGNTDNDELIGDIILTPGLFDSGFGQIWLNGVTRIRSLAGLLKGTAGVVSAITDNSATWNAAQVGDATLTALAGLDSSAGFLKQTAADTFAKDAFGTATYIPVSSGSGFTYNPEFILTNTNTLTLNTGQLSITGTAGAANTDAPDVLTIQGGTGGAGGAGTGGAGSDYSVITGYGGSGNVTGRGGNIIYQSGGGGTSGGAGAGIGGSISFISGVGGNAAGGGVAGGTLTFTSGQGGTGAGTGGAGGAMTLAAGTGGTVTVNGLTGGIGGNFSLTGGPGGICSDPTLGSGGAGGSATFAGGVGGNATGAGVTGSGGNIYILGGAAGIGGAGGGVIGNTCLAVTSAGTPLGFVGIRTKVPTSALCIWDNTSDESQMIRIGGASTYDYKIYREKNTGTLIIQGNQNGNNNFSYKDDAGNVLFRILENGNVGVGVVSPTVALDIAGAGLLVNDTTTVTTLKASKNVATVSAGIAPADFIQDSTTGACEVLRLQQDDESEEFVDFVGTTGGATGADSGESIIVALSGIKYKLKLYALA